MKRKLRWFQKLGLWGAGALLAVFIYGWATDCQGTAGYTYCSPIEQHILNYGY